ncbi:hypothetical protein L6452_33855 [Arctium lappa]|uniref:Uncharacterized protein n=1 Tax=Arctium lappa TaxID=4217 RepID=A0ACB8YH92_ARCLA|nr:hypothetical protein L6452_33855 [Arctium lappa]
MLPSKFHLLLLQTGINRCSDHLLQASASPSSHVFVSLCFSISPCGFRFLCGLFFLAYRFSPWFMISPYGSFASLKLQPIAIMFISPFDARCFTELPSKEEDFEEHEILLLHFPDLQHPLLLHPHDPKSGGSSEVIVEMRPNSNCSTGNPYLDPKPPFVADSLDDDKMKRVR